jgi:DNA-3-methyladenine glycosylase I
MIPSHHHTPTKPASLSGYLETMSWAVFSSGMSWRVVDAKSEGMREAFLGFDPERVAAMTDADIERLVEDRRIIRNRKKIEATIDNAAAMVELDQQYGGFDKYLSSRGSFQETVAALRRDFRFLGESSSYFFLWAVAEPVPPHEEWSEGRTRAVKRVKAM